MSDNQMEQDKAKHSPWLNAEKRGYTCAHCSRDMRKNPAQRCSNDGLCVSIEDFDARRRVEEEMEADLRAEIMFRPDSDYIADEELCLPDRVRRSLNQLPMQPEQAATPEDNIYLHPFPDLSAPTSPNAEREKCDLEYYKRGFNAGRKIGFREGIEAAAKCADNDPELIGDVIEKLPLIEQQRCAVRATKRSIARSIRALTLALPVEDGKENN